MSRTRPSFRCDFGNTHTPSDLRREKEALTLGVRDLHTTHSYLERHTHTRAAVDLQQLSNQSQNYGCMRRLTHTRLSAVLLLRRCAATYRNPCTHTHRRAVGVRAVTRRRTSQMSPPTGVGGGVALPRLYTTYGHSVYDARKPIVVQPPYLLLPDAAHLASYDAAAPVPSIATQLPSIHEPKSCTGDGDHADAQRLQPISRREPRLRCPVVHARFKTGGETVRYHLHHRARKHGWAYVDLYTRMLPHSLRGGRWEVEHAVHTLARHLNTSKPKVVVHQHDGVGGFGDYFLDRVLRPLSCRFRAEGRGCEVIAITVLREPTARIISQARSDNLPLDIFPAYARAHANFQTKYTLFTTDWRVESLFQGNASVETSLLEPALSVLSHFELIGRTEDLAHFISVVDERMAGGNAASAALGDIIGQGHSGSGREGNGGEGRNHSGTASAPSTTALHRAPLKASGSHARGGRHRAPFQRDRCKNVPRGRRLLLPPRAAAVWRPCKLRKAPHYSPSPTL